MMFAWNLNPEIKNAGSSHWHRETDSRHNTFLQIARTHARTRELAHTHTNKLVHTLSTHKHKNKWVRAQIHTHILSPSLSLFLFFIHTCCC